ncbi:hypothetical protein BJY01DRAFT_221478 [Aspergillus pseudoustus]|uniref:Peptidase M20 dimerisation domain-containing protein n=1 Tax=Aspergillus pseudoustus TaxID=1810923 RepID=A0ABR4J9Z5_9EURO
MVTTQFLLLASGITASASVLPYLDQTPLGISTPESAAFQCDLPPVLDPARDGLPSAETLFASHEALETQVKRHQAIVKIPSVCWDDMGEIGEDDRWKPFYKLIHVLRKHYPAVHAHAQLDKINTFGLLYTFPGSDPSLKPTLLTAHQDVVPVADESTWRYPPFDAHFDGEYIWGRGASDDKNSLTAILSAVEGLLSESNWEPRRTLLLAFGFDEECSSNRGAGPIGELITSRYGNDGIAVILDEGGFGAEPLDDKTLYVLPAVTEKGHVNLNFELRVKGGHSSVPLPHTGIGIISEIVVALERNPYQPRIIEDSPVHRALTCQARYSPDAQPKIRHLLTEGDLDGLAEEFAATSPLARFVVQTSQAVDIIGGGVKINAMPEVVELSVNYRVAPHQRPIDVQRKAVEVIGEIVQKYGLKLNAYEGDEEYHGTYPASLAKRGDQFEVDYNGTLTVTAQGKGEAAPVSPSTGPVWDVFSGTIQHTFAVKDKTVVPVGYIMTGNTDTVHYRNLSGHVYRWTPSVTGSQGNNIHTVDERIKIDDHLRAVRFYYNFVRNLDAAEL